MRLRWNPIVRKDLQVTARSMRLSWGLFAYETVLTITFLLALAVIQQMSRGFYSGSNVYGYLIYLFPALSIAQVCIVALIVPVITASAISGEKERQHWYSLLCFLPPVYNGSYNILCVLFCYLWIDVPSYAAENIFLTEWVRGGIDAVIAF